MGQNQWYHFGVGAPPILSILVGIGMFIGSTIWILTHRHQSLGLRQSCAEVSPVLLVEEWQHRLELTLDSVFFLGSYGSEKGIGTTSKVVDMNPPPSGAGASGLVDGQNLTPVGRWFIPVFIGVHPSELDVGP